MHNYKKMNKKGSDKILSVYWFFILFIVAAAVVYMVAAFYGKPYDVRGMESQILSDKAAECLVDRGYINPDWQTLNSSNLLQRCSLNFNTESDYGWNNDQYYLEVSVSNFTSGLPLVSAYAGNANLKGFCGLKGGTNPVCTYRQVYAIGNNNTEYSINITSIVRKTEKNV